MSSPYLPINFTPGSGGGAPGGSNQNFSVLPTLPNMNPGSMSWPGLSNNSSSDGFQLMNPMSATTSSSPLPSSTGPGQNISFNFPGPATGPGMTGIGKGEFAENPLNPALTNNFFNYLNSQIGQGVANYPGQLSAPINDILQQLSQAYGQGGTLNTLATQGFDATSLFKTMKDQMQRTTDEGAANLKEQFNFAGGLAGSPFGTAATDYNLQSTKDLNSLLGQLNLTGLQDQMQAAGQMGQFGQGMQALDQASLDRMYQEFIRTQPQNNPLLSFMYGASTTFPPTLQPGSGMGGLGALLSGAGGAAGGIGSLIKALGMGGGAAAAGGGAAAAGAGSEAVDLGLLLAGGLCWIAELLYGKLDYRTWILRFWLLKIYNQTFIGSFLVGLYKRFGKRTAAIAADFTPLRWFLKKIFDKAVIRACKEVCNA